MEVRETSKIFVLPHLHGLITKLRRSFSSDNKYFCAKCSKHVDAIKRYFLVNTIKCSIMKFSRY